MEHQIYFINAPDIGRFKIGRTQSLPDRLAQIRAGAPCPVRCIAYANGAPELEPACHDAAEERGFPRLHGEWFGGVVTADDAAKIIQRGRIRLSKAESEDRAALHRRAFYAGQGA